LLFSDFGFPDNPRKEPAVHLIVMRHDDPPSARLTLTPSRW
jgi:hypothetical protein